MRILQKLILILSLSVLTALPLSAQANEAERLPSTPFEMNDAFPRFEELMADLMANIDMQLMMRLQATMMNNIHVIGPYTQEYVQCLKAEGVFDQQASDLKALVERAQATGRTCQVILESMLGQMKFDITPEEFEQGLSPEYREMLQL